MNEELLSDGTEENDTGFWNSLARYSFEWKHILLVVLEGFELLLIRK